MKKRFCQYCGKELKRKRFKIRKWGAIQKKKCPAVWKRKWQWESLYNFTKKRIFCNVKCHDKYQRRKRVKLKCRWCGKQFKNPPSQVGGIKNAGRFCSHYCAGKLCNTVYTKKIIKKKFKRIKSKSKFNTCWLRDNHQYLLNATRRRYGKNSWYKFLQNINEIDKMRRNYINPKYKRIARAFLKYWTGNQDNLEWERPIAKIGKRFNWSNTWGLPIDGYEALDTRALYPSIEYLIKVKAIRLLKRGGGNEKGRIGDQRHRPNQYILLKTRI